MQLEEQASRAVKEWAVENNLLLLRVRVRVLSELKQEFSDGQKRSNDFSMFPTPELAGNNS